MTKCKSIAAVFIMFIWYRIVIWFFVILFLSPANAQNHFKIPDSLRHKDLDYLAEKLENDDNSSFHDSLYAWSYLSKAKSERNPSQIVAAYKYLLHISPKKLRLIYADSMVYTASQTGNNLLRGSSYLTRGIVFYAQNDYAEALTNYILANQYILKTKDRYLIYKIKYNLALMKYYLGYYDEALSLLNECVHYYETEGGKPYLYSLHATSLCYQSRKNYSRSSSINAFGKQKAKAAGEPILMGYFEQCEGVNNYFLQNHPLSITQLNHSLPFIIKNNDAANVAVSYFYLGKNALAQQKTPEAIAYLEKIDTAYRNGTYLRSDVWESFDILSGYYRNKGDHVKSSYYANASLSANRVSFKNYKALSGKMAIDYYDKRFREAEERTNTLRYSRNMLVGFFLLIVIALLLIIFLFRRQLKRQRRINRKKFKKIFYDTPPAMQSNIPEDNAPTVLCDVPPEITKKILDYLDVFQSEQHYLDKNIGLPELAKLSGSNTSYVSKVINHYKEKTVPDYLDSLKIAYIHHKLRTDKNYKNYTLQALAEDCGFKTAQKFGHAFMKHSDGLRPHYFIQQMLNEKV